MGRPVRSAFSRTAWSVSRQRALSSENAVTYGAAACGTRGVIVRSLLGATAGRWYLSATAANSGWWSRGVRVDSLLGERARRPTHIREVIRYFGLTQYPNGRIMGDDASMRRAKVYLSEWRTLRGFSQQRLADL